MRIFYKDMKEKMQKILVKNGFDEKRAEESAKNFADSSLDGVYSCLLYTSPSPRDDQPSRMPSSA